MTNLSTPISQTTLVMTLGTKLMISVRATKKTNNVKENWWLRMLVPITLITKIPIQNHNNNLVLTANLKWRCNNNKNQRLTIPRNKRRAMIKLKCTKISTTRLWSQRILAAITIENQNKKWTRLTLTKKVGILCRIEMTKATKNPYAK